MTRKRGLLQLLALLFAFALVAAACGDSDDDSGDDPTDTTAVPTETSEGDGEPTETTEGTATTEATDDGDDGAAAGGELVLGAEQWPECINPIQSCANASWRTWAVGTHIEARAMELDENNAYVPSPVLVDEPTAENGGLVTNDDGTFVLTYNINPDAVWSDGTPITSTDFEFTWQAYMNTTGVLTQAGYDLITGVDTTDPKTAVITFSEPYAPWPDKFGGTTEVLLPAHAFEGPDIADDWLQENTVSGGPWLLESFSAEQAIFVPNDNYWVEDRKPLVDRVVIVPLEDTDTEVAALQAGEVQAIFPQPFPGALDRLTGDLTYLGGGGTFMEGLWINQNAPEENAGAQAVDSIAVRKALAYSVDRAQVADIALGTSIENPGVLNCAGWNPTFGDWCDQSDFEGYVQDMAMVEELLTGDGWTRPDPNGLWQKDGQDLVLQWNTVAGNARREDVQALVVEMTRPFGIGWEIVNYDAGELFENRLPSMNFGPVALFANSTSPDPSVVNLYGQIPTEENGFTGQNYNAWDNSEVFDLALEADRLVDPVERLPVIQQIGDIAAEEVPWIPLYLLPNAFAYRTAELGGAVGDYTFHAWGGFHNMYDWELTG